MLSSDCAFMACTVAPLMRCRAHALKLHVTRFLWLCRELRSTQAALELLDSFKLLRTRGSIQQLMLSKLLDILQQLAASWMPYLRSLTSTRCKALAIQRDYVVLREAGQHSDLYGLLQW